MFFIFTDPAPTEISTLSLPDALPICATATPSALGSGGRPAASRDRDRNRAAAATSPLTIHARCSASAPRPGWIVRGEVARSEEHTSELQSHSDLVCRLLLEKKKKKQH